jgi:hypothetical protein
VVKVIADLTWYWLIQECRHTLKWQSRSQHIVELALVQLQSSLSGVLKVLAPYKGLLTAHASVMRRISAYGKGLVGSNRMSGLTSPSSADSQAQAMVSSEEDLRS